MTTLDTPQVNVETNVFKQLRQKHNFSLEDLARRVHISKQALIRLEQGTFIRPLPSVIDWWVDNYGYNWSVITEAYEGFRTSIRATHAFLFGDNLSFTITSDLHPLRQLRGARSISDTAKSLCIPQATLQHWEKKWKTQQTVPKEFCGALLELRYTTRQVREFSEGYTIWRNRRLGRLVGTVNGGNE